MLHLMKHAAMVSLPSCRAADRAEGAMIRQKALEEAAELRAKEDAWRAKLQAMNNATKAANQTLREFRAKEKDRERQMEEAIEGKERQQHKEYHQISYLASDRLHDLLYSKPTSHSCTDAQAIYQRL